MLRSGAETNNSGQQLFLKTKSGKELATVKLERKKEGACKKMCAKLSVDMCTKWRRLFISVCNMGLKENSFVSIAVLLSRLSMREAGIGSGSGSMHPVKVKKLLKNALN